MIVVNYKTYKEATGFKAVELARICKKVMEATGVRIVVVPQFVDLEQCVEVGIDCWAQHVDHVGQGKFTGWVNVEAVQELGVKGTLLNHSEHRLDEEVIKKTVEEIGDLAFEVCICTNEIEEAKKLSTLGPDYLAYEPSELIGSKDKSVASEKPDVIEKIVKAVNVPVLIGAGVHSENDVRVGIKFGARGVLLATDVVLAEDPEKELFNLASGFK